MLSTAEWMQLGLYIPSFAMQLCITLLARLCLLPMLWPTVLLSPVVGRHFSPCSACAPGAGTEGSFTFAVPDVTTGTPCLLTVKFDNPYIGDNEYSCSLKADDVANCGNKVFCAVGNGGGNDGKVLTTVWRA